MSATAPTANVLGRLGFSGAIRADFDDRDVLLRQFPTTFSVPNRFAKHMMVVADLATADAGAIEDALVAARECTTPPTEPDPVHSAT